MKIGITGITGFIGSEVARQAVAQGHTVIGFSRRPREARPPVAAFRRLVPGSPIDASDLDAVVNLAGESILGLWTESRKHRIRQSRIETTQSVVAGIAEADPRPPVLVNASAIGYYGDTGDRPVDESSPAGHGFLAGVSEEWEAEAARATDLGTRVVSVRIGFVIGPGGALAVMKKPFAAGLGGKLGSGRQWMSCIHVADVAGIVLAAIGNPAFSGAVNAVQPQPVTNAEFTDTLGQALRRPTLLPAPEFVLRLALGDFSHLLLDSQRILPGRLGELGYALRFPDVKGALLDGLAGL